MPQALRETLRALRALAEDHRSGAAEIADRATALVEDFCRGQRRDDPRLPYALSALAETTLGLHPSMAPLLNLANCVQLAAEEPRNSGGAALARLRRELAQRRRARRQAAAQIARHFRQRLAKFRTRRLTVLTYSYSSTVLQALAAARHLERVIVSEGRPRFEGRVLAERLAARQIPVTLVTEAVLVDQVAAAEVIVVGADAVRADSYVNKVGTRLLQARARAARKPFFVLADTAKFLPAGLERFHRLEEQPGPELWRGAPAGVALYNPVFEAIPFEPHVTLLSERGPHSPGRVRAWAQRQPVARRWGQAERGGGR